MNKRNLFPTCCCVGQKEIEYREVEEIAMVKNMVPQKGLEEIPKSSSTTEEDFKEILKNKGGFLSAIWDGSVETE